MSSPEPGDAVAANVAQWTKANADHTDGAAERQWDREELGWGVFGPGAEDPAYYGYVTVEWARQWPAEEIWVARKRA